ncbi:MAG TPA: 30S ribosomal protein S6 [Candidatus Magasanikbacteria bacterium]|jgi:small subunit ribosomal protein S6|nr:30S ribosomal protein S6 [Candidatus Magasanikbacteria bacterium]HQF57536.1 30S ribosomal protein S6 [Candidatus Magasanikbacteria bacterium]HQL52966.1 30S ribosomal protein S6 [Candidatus Magasanikbacteria bacterium]
MNHYELLFVLPGTLSENETEPLVNKIKTIIEKNGGQKLTVAELEKRRLAYPMKHIRYGYFGLAYFEAEPEMVKKMEAGFVLDRDFLRTFVKKINPKTHTLREINFGQIPTVGTESQPSASIRKSQEEEFATINKKTEIEETPEVEEVREEIFDDEELSKEKKSVKKSTVKKEEKINLDDIDKKLDEILDIDLNKV